MGHGRKYQENGETYMEDHINGVDWHVPSSNEENNPFDENGNWKDNW